MNKVLQSWITMTKEQLHMKVTIVLMIFISLTVFSCAGDDSARINNILTDKHVLINGTRVSIIPPDGFAKGGYLTGFRHDPGGAMIIIGTVQEGVASTLEIYTEGFFTAGGADIKSKEDLLFNGYPARLLEMEQQEGKRMLCVYLFIFGDKKTTIVLKGLFPKEQESKLGRAVKNSLLSAVYEPGRIPDPDILGNFRINISGTKLTFAAFYSQWFVYTPDGLYPTKALDKTTLTIFQTLHTEAVDDLRQLAEDTLQSSAYQKKIENREEHNIVVHNMQGYEITVYTKDFLPKKRKLHYLAILKDEEYYYIFSGTTTADFEQNLRLFKNICASFRRK